MEWNDAYSTPNGWVSSLNEQTAQACKCFSIGYYFGANQAGDVLLAGSFDTSNPVTVNNVMARPIQMIQKVTLLKKGKKPK